MRSLSLKILMFVCTSHVKAHRGVISFLTEVISFNIFTKATLASYSHISQHRFSSTGAGTGQTEPNEESDFFFFFFFCFFWGFFLKKKPPATFPAVKEDDTMKPRLYGKNTPMGNHTSEINLINILFLDDVQKSNLWGKRQHFYPFSSLLTLTLSHNYDLLWILWDTKLNVSSFFFSLQVLEMSFHKGRLTSVV